MIVIRYVVVSRIQLWNTGIFPTGIIYLYTIYGIYIITGWWFGTFFLFSHILGIIIPTDYCNIFQRGWNHQPDIYIMHFRGNWVSPHGETNQNDTRAGIAAACRAGIHAELSNEAPAESHWDCNWVSWVSPTKIWWIWFCLKMRVYWDSPEKMGEKDHQSWDFRKYKHDELECSLCWAIDQVCKTIRLNG